MPRFVHLVLVITASLFSLIGLAFASASNANAFASQKGQSSHAKTAASTGSEISDELLTEQDWIQALATKDPEKLKALAKQLYQDPIESVAVNDALAKQLVERYRTKQPETIDSVAWLCRALGATKHGRYYTLLLDVKRHGAHKKVRKYAKIGLKQLGYATADQFLNF